MILFVRRWLALGILLAVPVRPGAIETAHVENVPLQLSLPFAAAGVPAASLFSPAAMTLPASSHLADSPIAAAPAASVPARPRPAWGAMPAAVEQAFRSGDAREFLTACRRTDFTPPETDDAQQNLLREGAVLAEADRLASVLLAAPAAAAPQTRGTKIDYAAFGRALARNPGLRSGIFESLSAKRAILKSAGYTHLHGAGGKRIALDQALDARVARAFASTLRAYRNRSAR